MPRKKVAIIYPFFAHYRAPVLKELLEHGEYEYLLVGDNKDDSRDATPTIESICDTRLIHAPCVRLPFGLMWQRRIVGLAARGTPDCLILLGNAAWPASWLCALIARLRGIRVLFWTHGWIRDDSNLKDLARCAFYKLAHGLLLYGTRAREIAMQKGFSPRRLYVIYNSLDFEHQQLLRAKITRDDIVELRRQLFDNADVPVVIAVARLTQSKRFDLLVAALGLVMRIHHPVHLLVVGEGALRSQLERQARREGVKAAFIGACYDESALARYFACANVTVSPGNVGLTCMHSLAYGVPVITHDDPNNQMPEWEAIVPDSTGSLFALGSIDSLAAAVIQWTQSPYLDTDTRERCVSTIRRHYHPAAQRALIDLAVGGIPATKITQQSEISLAAN